ncbi:uncharacterized protein [Amphiura filiformis]|uniref:uncharacterized protein n=1 Tax=Amphiura filiformis TaxID=82378 RepID=UPI003B21E678
MDGITLKRQFDLIIIYLVFPSHNIIRQVSAYNCSPKFGSKQEGHLVGHVANAYKDTRSLVDCAALCGRHSTCLSVNYELKTGDCELNDQTIALAEVEEFTYSTNNMLYMEVLNHADYRGCGGTMTDYAATFGLDSYGNNWSCTWNIQVCKGKRIQFQFMFLDTETCCDGVTLNLRHNRQFRGSTTPSGTYVSNRNTVSVTFTSDYSVIRTGFVLIYKTVD